MGAGEQQRQQQSDDGQQERQREARGTAGSHLASGRAREGEGGKGGLGGAGPVFDLATEPRPQTAQGRLGSSRGTAWHSAKGKDGKRYAY